MSNRFAEQERAQAVNLNQNNEPAGRRVSNDKVTLANPNALMHRTMARNPVSSAISSIQTALTELPDMKMEEFKKLVDKGDLKFIPYDGEAEDAEISAVILARRSNHAIATVAITIRATATDLGEAYIEERRDENGNRKSGQPIVIPRVPTDVFSESAEMQNRVMELVLDAYPEASLEDVYLNGQIITPPGLDVTKPESIRPIIYRALESCESLLVDLGEMNSNDFSFTSVPSDGSLAVRPRFGGEDEIDMVGNLVRSDVQVETVLRQKVSKNGRNSVRTTPQTILTGFMDAIYTGQNIDDTRSNVWTPDNMQSYVPALVVTGLDSRVNAVSLTQLLFAVASAGYLADKNRWVEAFNPIYAARHKERFVGGLGRDIPLMDTPIRRNDIEMMGKLTPDASFDYIEFCRNGFYLNNLVVAIDLEEGGQLSPVQSVLMAHANGNNEATDAILAALDYLFGGDAFSSLWKDAGSPALFISNNTRIPLGTFVDANGNLRDVRNIDMLWMQNMVDDVELIGKLSDAYYNTSIDDERRLSDALEVLRTMNSTFELTGYANRIIVTPEFNDLFQRAARSTGLTIGPESDFDISRTARGHRNYINMGLGGSGDSIYRRRGGESRGVRNRDNTGFAWGYTRRR